ncbi:MAG: hypothetical protein ACKOW9_03915 [Candidatus Paceibacterota bacterium]
MFTSKFRTSAVLSLWLLVAMFSLPGTVKALTLSPTRFELFGEPGQTLSGEIKLINETNKTETLYVTYANFEAQGESGTPAFVTPDEGIGTWIQTEKDTYVVPPGKQELVPFTISIPKNAEPGGNFGVVFFGNTPSNSSQVAVGSQTGVLILLSVAGDVREDAGLLSFNTEGNKFWYKTLPVTFEYRFKNDGGDRVKPLGKINIRNTFFIRTERLNANPIEGNVLPGSTRKFKIDWLEYEKPLDYVTPSGFLARYFDNVTYQWKNFALGFYSANLRLEYGSAPEKDRDSTFFFVFPWELFIVLIIVLSIVFFSGRFALRRYNRYIIAQAQKGSIRDNTHE